MPSTELGMTEAPCDEVARDRANQTGYNSRKENLMEWYKADKLLVVAYIILYIYYLVCLYTGIVVYISIYLV